MNALEPVPLETLSDDDAVSLLFELAGHGEDSREKLRRLDAVVYGRLARAYDGDQPPPPRPCSL